MARLVPLVALLAALSLAPTANAAHQKGGGSTKTGYDISYPQCGHSLPKNVSFAIVGVNDGIVFSANPCLSSELAWAKSYEAAPILYANTGDPGPARSSHWPAGQTSPELCDAANPDTPPCAYDYGWNAAADSYADAANAGAISGEWWLDVESANSWEANTANNVAELQGEVAYLQNRGATTVGFYALASDWETITGGTTAFAALPSWRPGAGTQSTAASFCGTVGVTGGPTRYSQYASGGFDADVRCP
jgi:hypothetical protein